jgi:hypothetical protein
VSEFASGFNKEPRRALMAEADTFFLIGFPWALALGSDGGASLYGSGACVWVADYGVGGMTLGAGVCWRAVVGFVLIFPAASGLVGCHPRILTNHWFSLTLLRSSMSYLQADLQIAKCLLIKKCGFSELLCLI